MKVQNLPYLFLRGQPLKCALLMRVKAQRVVEKGAILVLLREVFRYELKEDFADVSFHAAVKREDYTR